MAALLECRCTTSSRSYQTVAPGRAATLKPTSFAWRECVGGSSGARAITPCRVIGHPLALNQPQKAMQRQRVRTAPLDLALRLQALERTWSVSPAGELKADVRASLSRRECGWLTTCPCRRFQIWTRCLSTS